MNYEQAINSLKHQYEYFLWSVLPIKDGGESLVQTYLSPLDNVITQAFKENILSRYEAFLLTQHDRNSPEFQTLLSGLDSLLTHELKLRDYSAVELRRLPDRYQLGLEELAAITVENPHKVVDVGELRALYGRLGAYAFKAIILPRTEGNLKETVVGMRVGSPWRHRAIGKKTALALEDYLVWKTGYSPKKFN